jgi:hypothetical protein
MQMMMQTGIKMITTRIPMAMPDALLNAALSSAAPAAALALAAEAADLALAVVVVALLV